MLRLLALVLLLANGLFFAWSHELLRGLGLGPTLQGEPQRLAQQISPDAVQLLKPEEFRRIEEQIKIDQATECLQAGPFDAAHGAVLRQALGQLLPLDSWELQASPIAARWIVYMGKYASNEVLAKKRAEVAAMNLNIERLLNASLEPGFSLGAFEVKADADSALARLSARGLHTARVVQERASGLEYRLVLPTVGAALMPKVLELGTALGAKSLHACSP
jgi:hypothetical protein